jgi:uncharacterized delta-60 repeat protein
VRARWGSWMVVWAVGAAVAAVAASAAGDLAAGFGSGGTVTTESQRFDFDVADALVIQPDGKLVTAGSSSNIDGESGEETGVLALARYDKDGRLDPSFGSDGIVTTKIGIAAGAEALVLQPDGKLVAAGSSLLAASSSGSRFALARYDKNGRLDPSFGNGGTVTTTIGKASGADALVLQRDGKLVAAGQTAGGGTKFAFSLVRYDRNGRLDPSFGSGGIVTTTIGKSAAAWALVLQPDGKLVAAGDADSKFALARYDRNGRLDPTFGSGGIVTTTIGKDAGAVALVRQSDGKLVAAGYNRTDTTSKFALTRYDRNGRLDRSFGSGGIVTTTVGKYAGAAALAIQPDGKLVAAGSGGSMVESKFALARYGKSGRLDPRFGSGGTVTTAIGKETKGFALAPFEPNAWAVALVLQPDGKLVAAGSCVVGVRASDLDPQAIALARYNQNGQLDK